MRLTDTIGRAWRWVLGTSSHPRRLTTSRPAGDAVGTAGTGTSDAPSASVDDLATTAVGSPRIKPVDRGPQRALTESRAALMQAFDAAHPVERRRELHGRDEQLQSLFDGVLYQRKHAIVYGARGSGKTSLVRVFADHADRQGVVLIYLACDANSNFADLMRPFLRFVPSGNIPVGRERAFRAQVDALPDEFGPRAIVSLLVELAPKPIIFILDEFDRVTDQAVRDALATTMKLLSDAKAPVQLLVVGIAQSVTELVHHHPSLRRHMVAVAVRRIADSEIERLIDAGAARAQLTFSPEARSLIVDVSCGSPYHARLFAYHAGLRALKAEATQVDPATARAGLLQATSEWGQMNEADFTLFSDLASADRPATSDVVTGTRLTAREHTVASDRFGDDATRLLGPALEKEGELTRFRDSLAPQFLLAMLMVGDQGEAAVVRSRVVGIRE